MAINALNVLCTHDVSFRHPSKRSKFFPDPKNDHNQMIQLAKGIDIWRGYFSSIRMASLGGLVLNFDLTSQPFLRGGNCVQVAKALTGARNEGELATLTGKQRIDLERGLKTIKVEVKGMQGKTHIRKKVQAVSRENARSLSFQLDDGTKSTVEQYFLKTYNIRLAFPLLPCVRLSKRAFYPMELVTVLPGQKYNRRLDPDQIAESIKWLTVKPQPRMVMLQSGLRANFHPDPRITPSFNAWGVKMDPSPLQITARELPPPKVILKEVSQGRAKEAVVQIRDGVWDMRSKQANTPGKVDRWYANHHPRSSY
jgi:eukaryotic translation initiation factor 2C